MKVIGLTGPSGAGKGICSAHLAKFGIPCIDTDQVYHGLICQPSPCTAELAQTFGNNILSPNGGIDRKALASIVFSENCQENTMLLNKITHKYVRVETDRMLDEFRKIGAKAVIVDAPLLFEAKFEELCDFCIAVIAPRDLRLNRIMARDGLSKEAAEARLSAQKEDEYYTSRSKYTVLNDSDVENIQGALNTILATEGLIC